MLTELQDRERQCGVVIACLPSLCHSSVHRPQSLSALLPPRRSRNAGQGSSTGVGKNLGTCLQKSVSNSSLTVLPTWLCLDPAKPHLKEYVSSALYIQGDPFACGKGYVDISSISG